MQSPQLRRYPDPTARGPPQPTTSCTSPQPRRCHRGSGVTSLSVSLTHCRKTRHTLRNHEEARGGSAYGKRRKISDPATASVEHAGCHSSKCFLLHMGVVRLCFDLHGVRPLLSELGAVTTVLRRGCVPVLQRLDGKPKSYGVPISAREPSEGGSCPPGQEGGARERKAGKSAAKEGDGPDVHRHLEGRGDAGRDHTPHRQLRPWSKGAAGKGCPNNAVRAAADRRPRREGGALVHWHRHRVFRFRGCSDPPQGGCGVHLSATPIKARLISETAVQIGGGKVVRMFEAWSSVSAVRGAGKMLRYLLAAGGGYLSCGFVVEEASL